MQMAYPASAFTNQQPTQFIQHRPVIQHHQQQPQHVSPATVLATPPMQQTGPSNQAGGLVIHQQLPQQPQQTSQAPPPVPLPEGSSKVPYGAGGDDDGYTLVFQNKEDFQAWREKEEIEQCVDFVKGDVHGSRAVPPRFKEHTKLVCARHVRSGRKKYVKKHPERQRKLPSRKLEGIGCNASISYKTYFDSEQVRASYNNTHSHPTGIENYAFTRRGRKHMANERGSKKSKTGPLGPDGAAMSLPPGGGDSDSDDGGDNDMHLGGGPDDEEQQVEHLTGVSTHSGPSVSQPPSQPPPQQQQQQQQPPPPPPQYAGQQVYFTASPSQLQNIPPPPQQQQQPPNPQPRQIYPKPARPTHATAPPPPPIQPPPPPPQPQPQPIMDNNPERWRWERLTAMFESVKANSRTFEYPGASLAALEATLVRLTLESPLGGTS